MLNKISVYPVNISGIDDLKKACERIGTDNGALAYLGPKSNILHFYANKIDYRAASFLKQEMLSRGGDVAVAKHVIDGKTDYSDILIMGTISEIRNLTEKMKAMNIWGIKELRESLCGILRNINAHEWELTSPAGHKISLNNKHAELMAIINLTPDSFHELSRFNENNILETAERFLNEGAYILDIGAESTRPGADSISIEDEEKRLLPSLRALRREFPDALISVDTYKAEIAEISASEGADIINDISGFNFDPEMLKTISDLNMPYVLSHIKGTPKDMAVSEPYENILGEINIYFQEKTAALYEAGFRPENLIIDPGIGFGKSADDNLTILKNIESLSVFGRPILVGHSRKRFTGSERLAGTLAVSALMAGRVSLLRVHDVKENFQALKIAEGYKSL